MLYLAYGMNTNWDEMAWRCPHARFRGRAALHEHALTFSMHCDVRPDPVELVWCALWLITPQCLQSLDSLEGYPVYYTRDWVPVLDECGAQHQALIYRMRNSASELAPPDQLYLDTVLHGYQQSGLPQDQVLRALDLAQSDLWTKISYKSMT